jgi:hypothetical protein
VVLKTERRNLAEANANLLPYRVKARLSICLVARGQPFGSSVEMLRTALSVHDSRLGPSYCELYSIALLHVLISPCQCCLEHAFSLHECVRRGDKDADATGV